MFALRRYASLRRLQVVLGLALMALVLAPSASGGAQLDTATATGSAGVGVNSITDINVDAHSGPAGENPGGTVSFGGVTEIRGQFFPVTAQGPVTCLNVTGNTAVIKFDATLFIDVFVIPRGPSVVTLVDNGGSGLDLFGFSLSSSAPADCSASFAVPGQPLNGRAVVFDAPVLPTSKAQCKKDGWQSFGAMFKNQGDCVSFVENGK